MPIQVQCATCGGMFHAPDNALGKTARCPTCGGPVEIKETGLGGEVVAVDVVPGVVESGPTLAGSLPALAEGGAGDMRRPCPMCGEMIQQGAIKCRFCGEIFDPAIARAEVMKGVYTAGADSTQMKQDKSTSILLLVTGLLGCFSPILAIYGIVFLVKRPHSFPNKGLAIAGTVLHCIWALVLISSIVIGSLSRN